MRIESAVAGKGSFVSIVVSHKAADLSDQVTDAAERAPADRPMGYAREPALDLIGSARVGERVIEVKARMAGEPRLDGIFLSGVVSSAHVRLKFGRNVGIDVVKKGRELLLPLARFASAATAPPRTLSAANSRVVPCRK